MKYILEKTVNSLSKKEIINYKLYTNRHNKVDSRKDVALFNSIRNAKKKDIYTVDSKIEKRHDSSIKLNTFQKLKTRLLNEIGTSLVQFYFHDNSKTYIYNELNLFDVFFDKGEWEISFFHLQKAEKMALKNQSFKLLALIYDEYVRLSIYYHEIAPQDYIKKRKENDARISQMQLLDDAIYSVRNELQHNLALIKTPKKLTDTLQRIIKNLGQKKERESNPFFRQKLFEAVSRLLIAKQEFVTLEAYCLKTYKEFSEKKYFTKETHEAKLQMLCYICNSLYENKKNNLALHYLSILGEALKEYDSLLHDKFVFFYYNSLANNYNIIDSSKAIEALLKAKKISSISKNSLHLLYIYWNLAGAYFDTKKPKNSLKNIVQLKLLEPFEKLNPSLKLYILIFELMLRIDLKQLDFTKKSILALNKEFFDLMESPEHLMDFDFIKILKLMLVNEPSSPKLNSIIHNFILKEYKDQSKNVVNYKKWLSEKQATK